LDDLYFSILRDLLLCFQEVTMYERYITSSILYHLWTVAELTQDSIENHDSEAYLFFEALNPTLFELWLSTGGV